MTHALDFGLGARGLYSFTHALSSNGVATIYSGYGYAGEIRISTAPFGDPNEIRPRETNVSLDIFAFFGEERTTSSEVSEDNVRALYGGGLDVAIGFVYLGAQGFLARPTMTDSAGSVTTSSYVSYALRTGVRLKLGPTGRTLLLIGFNTEFAPVNGRFITGFAPNLSFTIPLGF